MAKRDAAILTFRTSKVVKNALIAICDREHRSFTNMMEVLIRDYCTLHNIYVSSDVKEEVANNNTEKQS